MKLLFLPAIFICCTFFCSLSSAEQMNGLTINGSVKSFNLHMEGSPMFNDPVAFSSNRLRLDLSATLTKKIVAEISLDQRLLWTNAPAAVSLPDYRLNRFVDLEKTWHENEHLSGQLQVDRFNLHGDVGQTSWSVGRQAIGFGRISLFSPLDVIAPFPPDAIDIDVRPGVDAIKLTHYFGMAGQLGGVTVLGDEQRHNSYLVSAGENINEIDLLVLAGRLRGRNMVGAGLAGELGKVGIKGEMSCYQGVDVRQPSGDLQDDFIIAALEGWYRFENGLVLIGEYLFNGYGRDDPRDYPLVAASAPVREGLGFLLARHYLLLGPSYQFHPLVTFNGLVIYNIDDQSRLLRPQLKFSLADNLQMDIFWTVTHGKKADYELTAQQPVVRSEFGSAGDSGGVFLHWYF